MNDEFKKLDSFMQAHRPPLKEGALRPLPDKKKLLWIPSSIMAMGVAGLFIWQINSQHINEEAELEFFDETMSYELTSDELPQEAQVALEITQE